MRYRSLVDYMLIAFVLLREGLPLPEFVSDIPTLLLRPLREIVATVWRRLRNMRLHGHDDPPLRGSRSLPAAGERTDARC